MHGHLIPSSL